MGSADLIEYGIAFFLLYAVFLFKNPEYQIKS